MALTCQSCGGIIGRDCFNPNECAMIAAREESYERQKTEVNTITIDMLKDKFIQLLGILRNHGIDLGELYIPETKNEPLVLTKGNCDPTDDLPF